MKFQCVLIFSIVFVAVLSSVNAVSEPVCSYTNSEGERVFLRYLPYLKKGEEYVDFGPNGKCLKSVKCLDTFNTEIEECSKYEVTCDTKSRYSGVFPACCVKC